VSRSVAVVTGSSSGIGRAIALQLAGQGFDILVHAGRRLDRAEETAAAVRNLGVAAQVLVLDYTSVNDEFQEFVERAFAWQGRVDCWVNNAGGDVLTGEHRLASFAEKLDFLWQVDVRATLLISRQVAERMGGGRKRPGVANLGCVINLGWDQAWSGLPGDSGQAFSCTKGAVMALTNSLAKTYAPQVRFNCVAPGWIRTGWGQEADPAWSDLVAQQSLQRRWGEPADVAGMVGFLASPAAAYCNGQCLVVNGGLDGTDAQLRERLL